MSKETKRRKREEKEGRTLVIGIAAVFLAVCLIAGLVLYLCLREDRIDRAARILSENDYLVTVKREGDDSPLELNEKMNARLRGIDKNSLNVIYILEFKEEADAREFYELEKKEHTLTETVKRYGRYVYYGSIGSFELLE